MKAFNYTESLKKFYKALDYIDLTPYLKKDATIEEIHEKINNDCKLYKLPIELYQYIRKDNYLFADNDLFNAFDDYELLDYIESRYPQYVWQTEYIVRTWICEVMPSVANE